MKKILMFFFILSLIFSCQSRGRYYAYVSGDSNHTKYEDTILYAPNSDSLNRLLDRYSDSIRDYFMKNHYIIVSHYYQYPLLTKPKKIEKITLSDKKPIIPKYVPKPKTPSVADSDTSKKDSINITEERKKDEIKEESKKDDRMVHIRTNGSLDVGREGSINYNLRSGKVGYRVSEHVVFDSDGFHFSF